MIDEEEALPMRPMTQTNLHTQGRTQGTFFSSSVDLQSDVKGQMSIRGGGGADDVDDTGIVDFVFGGSMHTNQDGFNVISPITTKS